MVKTVIVSLVCPKSRAKMIQKEGKERMVKAPNRK